MFHSRSRKELCQKISWYYLIWECMESPRGLVGVVVGLGGGAVLIAFMDIEWE